VKLNFRRHAVFNAGLDAKATRTIDLHEGDRLDDAALRDLVRAAFALILSGLVSLFLLIDGGARLAGFAQYVEGLIKFGYSPTLAPLIGLSLLLSTVLYAVPRTTVRAWRHPRDRLPRRRHRHPGARGRSVVSVPRRPRRDGLGRPWCRSARIRGLLPLMR